MNDKEILKTLGVPVKLFFGQENWQKQFPDKDWRKLFPNIKIVFPENIVLPTPEQLQQPSAITNKTVSQAINNGDYIVIVIPKLIDGIIIPGFINDKQPINLKLLHLMSFDNKINRLNKSEFYSYEDNNWYKRLDKKENFMTFYSQSIIKPGLLIIKLLPLKNSFNKDWHKQQAIVPNNHRTANTAEETIKHLCYYSLTSQYINQTTIARTKDIDNYGNHVSVSGLSDDGLRIASWPDDYDSQSIGLSSVWDFES